MNKFIFVLKAFEKELDRQAAILINGTSSNIEAIKQRISTTYLQLAMSMTDEGYIEQGLSVCRKALCVKPDNVDANYFILNKLERLNRFDEAWTALHTFENEYGSLYGICKKLYLLKAFLEYRRGNLEKAREMQERFIKENPLHSHQAEACGALGKTLDSLGLYDLAMKAFHAYNEKISSTPDGIYWIRQSNDVFSKTEARLRWYRDKNSFDWQSTIITDELASPVLLVGFPRSGTTLLDQILNSHTRLTTIEEKATLSGLLERFHGSEDKIRDLSLLNNPDNLACRQLYWSNVASFLNKPLDKFTVVDKFPLNIRYLDIFARLFPDVKIIVAIRDPRDVVLSNYMQMYGLNPEMATNLNLVSSARFYAKVMELYLLFRKFIPDNIYEIRYEDLVCDFTGEITKLLGFLGLAWDNKLAQYHEHAKKRDIRTLSYGQVIKPIYHNAVGRWKNYARHLEEIKPLLQPFVEKFGYST